MYWRSRQKDAGMWNCDFFFRCRRIEKGRGSAYSEKDGVEEVEGTSGERGNGFTRFLF